MNEPAETDHAATGRPLGVLDLSPIPSGATAAEALARTVDLAQHAERRGYFRYWLAEHHNTPGLASSSPEVMIATVAMATSRIRVGAGGIMLPNHSPLKVAETFRALEALHPGRIDLGVGRAPGTDGITAYALRRCDDPGGADDFPSQLGELFAYSGGGFPDGHPFRAIRAVPDDVPLPPVWLLGSSEYGAGAAAALGLGLAFAHHLNPRRAPELMRAYRDRFRPSETMAEPRAILAISAVCADTEEQAEDLAWSLGLSVIRMRSGRAAPLPTPDEARAHDYTERERDQLRRYFRAQVLGDPMTIREKIQDLAERAQADEVMVMTTVHDHAARRRSYELIAAALAPPAVTAAPSAGAGR